MFWGIGIALFRAGYNLTELSVKYNTERFYSYITKLIVRFYIRMRKKDLCLMK